MKKSALFSFAAAPLALFSITAFAQIDSNPAPTPTASTTGTPTGMESSTTINRRTGVTTTQQSPNRRDRNVGVTDGINGAGRNRGGSATTDTGSSSSATGEVGGTEIRNHTYDSNSTSNWGPTPTRTGAPGTGAGTGTNTGSGVGHGTGAGNQTGDRIGK